MITHQTISKKTNNLLKKISKKEHNEIHQKVKENGLSLSLVRIQTEELCLEAVKENGHAIIYVKKQTQKLCFEAVQQTPYAIKAIKNQTPKICLEVIKQKASLIRYIEDPSKELIELAFQLEPDFIDFFTENELIIFLQKKEIPLNILDILYNHKNPLCKKYAINHPNWINHTQRVLDLINQE